MHADSFIEKMPGGYDAPVTERGSTLSAGQRQLLSFARTLAYDPTILVLDEATANIDTETEALITSALAKLMEGRTTIMVAHRLSTIQHADKIIVMHQGQIKEAGTHQELLAQNGLYRNCTICSLWKRSSSIFVTTVYMSAPEHEHPCRRFKHTGFRHGNCRGRRRMGHGTSRLLYGSQKRRRNICRNRMFTFTAW